MKKILITGINGFAGSYLAEYCLEKNCLIHGIIRKDSQKNNLNTIKNKIFLHEGNLSDLYFVNKTINKIKPNLIFHLAGESSVKHSWDNPYQTIQNNLIGQSNIFQSIKNIQNYNPRIHIACSSEEYGNSRNFPITEEEPLKPISPYGLSKVVQDSLSEQYSKFFGFDIVRSRAFSHIGPRQRDSFVCSSFAKQIIEIEKGQKKSLIKVGNLKPKRDFTDVRDMVKAYWLILEKGKSGEVYNLCSGKKGTYSIQEILDRLLKLSKIKIEVKQDPNLMRPSDLPLSMGDYSKFFQQTEKKKKIPLNKTLQDLLDYWRKVL